MVGESAQANYWEGIIAHYDKQDALGWFTADYQKAHTEAQDAIAYKKWWSDTVQYMHQALHWEAQDAQAKAELEELASWHDRQNALGWATFGVDTAGKLGKLIAAAYGH